MLVQVLTAPIPIRFPANVSGEAAEDGPDAWAPASLQNSGSVCFSLGFYNHLWSKPGMEDLSCLSVSLSLPLPLWFTTPCNFWLLNKQINLQKRLSLLEREWLKHTSHPYVHAHSSYRVEFFTFLSLLFMINIILLRRNKAPSQVLHHVTHTKL